MDHVEDHRRMLLLERGGRCMAPEFRIQISVVVVKRHLECLAGEAEGGPELLHCLYLLLLFLLFFFDLPCRMTHEGGGPRSLHDEAQEIIAEIE